MWKWMNEILVDFRICFTRRAAFQWFVVIVIGLMIGKDDSGVTSIIRELALNSKCYVDMIHFFRASSWAIEPIREKWISLVQKNAPLIQVRGYNILVGDGIKQPKEAKKMPGVKKHHQESENVSKAKYIFGHLFGVIGVLAGDTGKMFCIPLGGTIQDGVKTIREWAKSKLAELSHVEQVVHLALECVKQLGKSIVVLDRLFLTINALKGCESHLDEDGNPMLYMVTKAKKTAVAYKDPPPYSGKGRPRVKGEKVKLWSLFEQSDEFETLEVQMYGRRETVKSMTIDLLWGKKLYRKLRFVLVIMPDGRKSILVSSLLSLTATEIIELYAWRFKIEVSFKELKHSISGFTYRFWSKHMPKLNRFGPSDADLLKDITDSHSHELIIDNLKAIEGYVMFACIALGMLQMIALKFGSTIKLSNFLWLRTKTNDVPTESTITRYLSKNIFRTIEIYKDFGIYQIIRNKQKHAPLEDYSEVS